MVNVSPKQNTSASLQSLSIIINIRCINHHHNNKFNLKLCSLAKSSSINQNIIPISCNLDVYVYCLLMFTELGIQSLHFIISQLTSNCCLYELCRFFYLWFCRLPQNSSRTVVVQIPFTKFKV